MSATISDSTRALIASLAVDLGYDEPAPRAKRTLAERRVCKPPGMYGWALVVGADNRDHIVRNCGSSVSSRPGHLECVDAGSGRRVQVPLDAFERRLSARDACLTAGFGTDDLEPAHSPEQADPWWLQRRRNPAFLAAHEYARAHPQLAITERLLGMRAAKRDDDHTHGAIGHRDSMQLSQFAAWRVQVAYDEDRDIVAALREWVLRGAQGDYWWYIRYAPVLKPATVWQRYWREHAHAIATATQVQVERLRALGLAQAPPDFTKSPWTTIGEST